MSGMQALDLKPQHQTPKVLSIQKQIPLFLYHGVADDMLPIEDTQLTYEYLQDNFSDTLTFDIEKRLTHDVSP